MVSYFATYNIHIIIHRSKLFDLVYTVYLIMFFALHKKHINQSYKQLPTELLRHAHHDAFSPNEIRF